MKKFDTLYWKAFWAWLVCFTLCFGSVTDAVFAIGIVAAGGTLLSAKVLIVGMAGMVLAALPAAGTTGWVLSDLTKFSEPTRTLLLCESAKQGWRLTPYLNPFGWIFLIVIRPLWNYVLEPVLGCVLYAVHNTRIVDDGPRREPLSEAERQVCAIGAVFVLFAIAVILKYHFFGH